MLPRLGGKYPLEVEVMSRPKAEYHTDEYYELDLPAAPAIMVGEEVVVEGSDIAEDKLESCICRCLRLPEPEKQGLLQRLFKR